MDDEPQRCVAKTEAPISFQCDDRNFEWTRVCHCDGRQSFLTWPRARFAVTGTPEWIRVGDSVRVRVRRSCGHDLTT